MFGLTHGLLHLAQDVHARFFGLRQRHLHDLLGDTLDFDVHLKRCDAVGGPGHFEVHVPQVIFVTQNISQNRKTVAIFDQTHGNTRHMGLHWNACIHQGQATAAYRGHR